MSREVTIEGTVTPSDRLGRGVRAKVQLTPEIRKLIKIGAVIIVDQELPADLRTDTEREADEQAALARAQLREQTWTPGDPAILPEMPESAYGPDSTPLEPVERRGPSDEAFVAGTDTVEDQSDVPPSIDTSGPKPPPRNGATTDWQAWVSANVPGADIEGLSRDELIAVWQKFDGE